MAFEDKKGIVVASPFKLQAEALLDVRQQVDTLAERDRLVTLKAATAGLRVFVKENSTSYVYTGSKWDALATGAPYIHPTGDGNHHVPATGTTNSGKYLKAGSTAGSEAWSKIAAVDITGLPTKLPNPKAITFTGATTGSYDGSAELTVNIPTSGKTDAALTLQLNGGTTEGSNKFTFDGSNAKNVNITPASIGAATSGHTHNYAGSSSAGGPANSAVKLATARTINGVAFDGTVNIEIPNNYSKTLTNEDLNTLLTPGNYFAAGGNTVKNKPSGVENFGLEVYKIAGGHIAQKLHGSNNIIYYRFHNGTSYGGWSDVYSSVNKPTPAEIGAAATNHTHSNYAPTSHTHTASQITGLPTKLPNPQPLKFTGAATATYDGSGAVTVNIPTAQASPFALTVQFNGGTTEGTNKFTFNGGAAKTVNITPASIGAATSGHTHNSIKDSGDARTITIAYSKDGLATADWFAAWSGNEIRAMSGANLLSAIKAAPASHTHSNYAPTSHTHTASQITGLPTSLKNPYALTIKTNGTAAATYDGAAAKEVNITPASIGAAATNHTHSNYLPTSHQNIQGSVEVYGHVRVSSTMDGNGVQPLMSYVPNLQVLKDVQDDLVSAINKKADKTHTHSNYAPTSHTHNYAGSSSAGGAANSAKKVDVPVGTILWSTSSSSTFFKATMGGTWEVVGNIDAIVNSSTTITFYIHKKTAL